MANSRRMGISKPDNRFLSDRRSMKANELRDRTMRRNIAVVRTLRNRTIYKSKYTALLPTVVPNGNVIPFELPDQLDFIQITSKHVDNCYLRQFIGDSVSPTSQLHHGN